MSELNIELLYKDIRDWKDKYSLVENLPIDFYLKYRDILFSLKKIGKNKEELLSFFLEFSEQNEDIKDFVDEIMDMIVGYCHKDFQVW